MLLFHSRFPNIFKNFVIISFKIALNTKTFSFHCKKKCFYYKCQYIKFSKLFNVVLLILNYKM